MDFKTRSINNRIQSWKKTNQQIAFFSIIILNSLYIYLYVFKKFNENTFEIVLSDFLVSMVSILIITISAYTISKLLLKNKIEKCEKLAIAYAKGENIYYILNEKNKFTLNETEFKIIEKNRIVINNINFKIWKGIFLHKSNPNLKILIEDCVF